jgi:hypothetical protein
MVGLLGVYLPHVRTKLKNKRDLIKKVQSRQRMKPLANVLKERKEIPYITVGIKPMFYDNLS